MSKLELKGFTEETFEDAAKIIRARFSSETAVWARKFLRNPLRSVCASAGDISYKDGEPMAFQAAVLRRAYIGKIPFYCITGSTFCKMPKAKPRYVLSVFEKTEEPRGGSKMSFGNTAVPITQTIAGSSGDSFGPESCAAIRFSILRLGGFVNFALKGRLPKCLVWVMDLFSHGRREDFGLTAYQTVDYSKIDSFWSKYLVRNTGLVLSRSAEELDWAFGEELRENKVRLYCHGENGEVDGYIIFKDFSGGKGIRWMVADWIALGDDHRILKELLSGGLARLKAETPATFVELIGYPMFVQRVIRACMPFVRRAKGNCVTYRFSDNELGKSFEQVKDKSWFFGAYDGDRAL